MRKKNRQFSEGQLHALYEHISCHVGEGDEITSKELKLDGPTVRAMVHALRLQGYPICSNKCGYYIASSPAEINNTITSIRSRVNEMTDVIAALSVTRATLLSTCVQCNEG